MKNSGLRSVGIDVFSAPVEISISTVGEPTITIFLMAQNELAARLCLVANHEIGCGLLFAKASGCGAALLIAQQDEISPAADTKLTQQIGNMKFHCSLGNIELASDLFVGQIFQQ